MQVQVDLKSSRPAPASAVGGEQMSIIELAGRFGPATHVRHCEDVGLLDPPRTPAGRRRYDHAHVTRVAVILRAKQAGRCLDDIRDLIATPAGSARRSALRTHRDAIRARIATLQVAHDLLNCAVECGADDIAACPHFQRELAAAQPDPRRWDHH